MNLVPKLSLTLILTSTVFPAHAGIFANIEVREARHSVNGKYVDGSGIPFAGSMSSNFVLAKSKCVEWQVPEYAGSMCRYQADFSGLESPYINAFNSRFQSASPITNQLSVSLFNRPDGSYFGWFTFLQGKTEFYTNDTGSYQASLTSNYQFRFEGAGPSASPTSDLNFARRIWSEGIFTERNFFNSWDVFQLRDAGDLVVESEYWSGKFAATVGTVPEPTTSLLMIAGLAALIFRRSPQNRAHGIR